jgi:hypothetical protein
MAEVALLRLFVDVLRGLGAGVIWFVRVVLRMLLGLIEIIAWSVGATERAAPSPPPRAQRHSIWGS